MPIHPSILPRDRFLFPSSVRPSVAGLLFVRNGSSDPGLRSGDRVSLVRMVIGGHSVCIARLHGSVFGLSTKFWLEISYCGGKNRSVTKVFFSFLVFSRVSLAAVIEPSRAPFSQFCLFRVFNFRAITQNHHHVVLKALFSSKR